jgi:hypothetical protein
MPQHHSDSPTSWKQTQFSDSGYMIRNSRWHGWISKLKNHASLKLVSPRARISTSRQCSNCMNQRQQNVSWWHNFSSSSVRQQTRGCTALKCRRSASMRQLCRSQCDLNSQVRFNSASQHVSPRLDRTERNMEKVGEALDSIKLSENAPVAEALEAERP